MVIPICFMFLVSRFWLFNPKRAATTRNKEHETRNQKHETDQIILI